MSEADKLRHNIAKYLAKEYLISPLKIAKLCDEELDRTGKLLGFVRDEAYLIGRKNNKERPIIACG